MLSIITKVFILLFRLSSSLARNRTQSLYLNDEPCMIRPTLIDLNPVELKYYSFMISLDNFSGSCNALFPKICAPKETKHINVNAFNMIPNKKRI